MCVCELSVLVLVAIGQDSIRFDSIRICLNLFERAEN